MSRLLERYRKEIAPELSKQLGIANPHGIPRVQKVVINSGVGRATQDSKHLETVSESIAAISGQHPIITKARKSIAGFKIRDNNPIGVMVTLRGERMYEFIDRLVSTALPRVRDFRGISADSFDAEGNYALGIKESNIFPELANREQRDVHGLQVNIITTAKTKEEGEALLRSMGFPLRKRSKE